MKGGDWAEQAIFKFPFEYWTQCIFVKKKQTNKQAVLIYVFTVLYKRELYFLKVCFEYSSCF